MKANKIIHSLFILVFLVFLIGLRVFFYSPYEIVSKTLNIILILTYFLMLALGIYSYFELKNAALDTLFLVLMPFITLFFSDKPIYFIPLLIFFIIPYTKRCPKYLENPIKIYHVLILILLFIFTSFSALLNGFAVTTEMKTILSPNHEYNLVWLEHDAGATGGSESVVVDKVKYGVRIYRHFLYSGNWGKKPVFKWINNSEVEINGKRLNIFNSPPIYEHH